MYSNQTITIGGVEEEGRKEVELLTGEKIEWFTQERPRKG